MVTEKPYKTEVYECAGGYVACTVNRVNDAVMASSKHCRTPQEAKEAVAARMVTQR